MRFTRVRCTAPCFVRLSGVSAVRFQHEFTESKKNKTRVHAATLIGGALLILVGGLFAGVIAGSPFGLAFTRSLQ